MLAEQHVLSYTILNKIQNAIMLRIFNVYGNGNISESDVITKFAQDYQRDCHLLFMEMAARQEILFL